MPVDFLNGGSLYVQDQDCEYTLIGENVYGVAEVELSADEVAPVLYHINKSPSVSFEMKTEDLDLLYNKFVNLIPTGSCTLQYQRPIMIQARWHKKARTRKKWLKRYGMKPDTVTVRVNVHTLEYHPGHILNDQYDANGICATFNNVEFEVEANTEEYILRPDQKRRDIKIEW